MFTVFTLLEARIWLYPTGADGNPLRDYPVWIGAGAENLKLTDSLMEVETRETGAPHPLVDHIGEEHQVEIERIWKVSRTGQDFTLVPNQKFVLVVVWTEDGRGQQWKERVYHGVTMRSDARASQGVLETNQSQQFRAESMTERSGSGAYTFEVPELPMTVRWVKDWEKLILFIYDPEEDTYAETVTGIANGRAAITVTPRFQAEIEDELAMEVTASGVLNVGELIEAGALSSLDSPRLEFWRGTMRLATLSKDGILRVLEAVEDTPEASTSKFEFYNGETLVATLEDGGLVALELEEAL